MADSPRNTYDREPAEGARENVNVPNETNEADPNPNRPGESAGQQAGTRRQAGTKRPSRADITSQPTRDEGRDEQPGEDNPHQPRRQSI